MSVFQGLTRMGQAQAEALMESTCVITRAGSTVVDHGTGAVTSDTATIYEGPCRLRFPFVRPQQADAAGQIVEKARGILSLPISVAESAQVTAGDVATITVNPADPGVVGTRLRIESPFPETHATARRLPVEILS
jgi:hypothetical protein